MHNYVLQLIVYIILVGDHELVSVQSLCLTFNRHSFEWLGADTPTIRDRTQFRATMVCGRTCSQFKGDCLESIKEMRTCA